MRSAELKALVKAGEEREMSLQQELEATRALAAKVRILAKDGLMDEFSVEKNGM